MLIAGGALAVAPLLQTHAAVEANSTEILIDVLVRKGILTLQEASEIRQEVESVAAATAAAPQPVAAYRAPATPSAGPAPQAAQVGGLAFSGDARFRFQAEDIEDRSTRSRWRYRARFGADYQFHESPFSMGMRLETASANDSTNVNYGGFFDKSDDELRLGLLYMQYAGDNLSVQLGKHEQPFLLSGAFWDSDINPEGLSEIFELGDWSLRFGQYIVDEEREDRGGGDDFLFVGQAVWNSEGGLSLAPMLMATTDGRSTASESASFAGENAVRDFRDFFVAALPFQYSFKDGSGIGHKFFGTIGKNLKGDDAARRSDSPFYEPNLSGDQDLFYNLGYQYGSARAAGTWQAGVEYRHIEGASYTPNLSDSDFAKNSMNHRGFLLHYQYAFTDFFKAGLTYMDSRAIDDDYEASVVANEEAKILQLDAMIKF